MQQKSEANFQKATGANKKQTGNIVKINHEIAEGYIIITQEGENARVSMENLGKAFYTTG
jgi:hypothetical protein